MMMTGRDSIFLDLPPACVKLNANREYQYPEINAFCHHVDRPLPVESRVNRKMQDILGPILPVGDYDAVGWRKGAALAGSVREAPVSIRHQKVVG